MDIFTERHGIAKRITYPPPWSLDIKLFQNEKPYDYYNIYMCVYRTTVETVYNGIQGTSENYSSQPIYAVITKIIKIKFKNSIIYVHNNVLYSYHLIVTSIHTEINL